MRWELLDRYLTDSCDSEERDEVDRWLAESGGHRRVLEQIAEALEQTSPEALQTVRRRLELDLGLERGQSVSTERTAAGKRRVKRPAKEPPRPPTTRAKKNSSVRAKTELPVRSKKKSPKQVQKPKPARRKQMSRRKKDG
jgi:hypothetical protein